MKAVRAPFCRADAEPVKRSCSGYPRAMTEQFKKGDKVTWQSHGSTAEGTVQKKITSDTEAAGRTVRASQDEPQYRCAATRAATTPCTNPRR